MVGAPDIGPCGLPIGPLIWPPSCPPINLKFFGTAVRANGQRQAFLLQGDDVFLASPGDIVARVNAAANQALADPEVKDKLARLGIEPVTSTPQQLATMVATDAAKWKKTVVERHIKGD